MKTNFENKSVDHGNKVIPPKSGDKKDFTENEFEEFILKSGAVGTYMIFRSSNKDDELGMEEL